MGVVVVLVYLNFTVYIDLMSDYRAILEQSGSGLALALNEEKIQNPVFFSGILALNVMLTSLISVLIARWWQALLFNPGAFGKEFRALSLGKYFAVVYVVLALLMLLLLEGGLFLGIVLLCYLFVW